MKFTNVKQLIIKFMGGGIINFPTRFLRWVKINGDTDDSDDGDGSSEGSLDINTILDNISIKDDLLTKLQDIDYSNKNPDELGVLTDLTFNDVFNDYDNFIEKIINRENNKNIALIQFDNTSRLDRENSDNTWQVVIYDEASSSATYYVFIDKEEIRADKYSATPK